MKVKKRLSLQRKKLNKISKDLKSGRWVPTKDLAEYLRWKTPKSEAWFQRKWKESGMLHCHDLFNQRFGIYIPDCINTIKKYVIEVDGSVHSNSRNRFIDQKKDEFYKSKGLRVFRIRAFNSEDLESVISDIKCL